MALRRTGLQKDVLALYRRALRLIPTKPPHAQPKFSAYIRFTFSRNARNISSRDFNTIEHALRVGRRQIEQLEDPSVRDCWVGKDMQEWVATNPGRRPRHTRNDAVDSVA